MFGSALEQARFALPLTLLQQRATFASAVRPALARAKTGYVLVDALRFEMACDLQPTLLHDAEVTLSVVVATAPTITEVGMAALLPGADGPIAVVSAGDGKVGLRIGETLIKDRAGRMEWFRRNVDEQLAITTLEELLPKPKAALDAELRQAKLIVVTSQEIDKLAEGDNIRLARRAMEDVLADIVRLVRILRDVGCATIIVTADHGYLFGEELDGAMKVDAPGGRTVDLHRRVWIGEGGRADAGLLRGALASFGLEGGLEFAVPRGLGAFKVSGGARAYFHGGLTLQELIVPRLVIQPQRSAHGASLAGVAWTLTPGSQRISTRFCSVTIAAIGSGMFDMDAPRVRVEVRSGSRPLSQTVAASYGLEETTGEVQLELSTDDPRRTIPATVTLLIEPSGKSATIHVLDAISGRELAKTEPIEVTILAY